MRTPTSSYTRPSRSNGRSVWTPAGRRGVTTRLIVPNHTIGSQTTANANATLSPPNASSDHPTRAAATTVATTTSRVLRTRP